MVDGAQITVITFSGDAPEYLTDGPTVMKLVKDNATAVLLNWLVGKGAEPFSRETSISCPGSPGNTKKNPDTQFRDDP